MALRRLGATALRHAAPARASAALTAPPPPKPTTATTLARRASLLFAHPASAAPSSQWPRQNPLLNRHHYSTVTTALAVASAAATVAKKVAAATAAAAQIAARARKATTPTSAALVAAKTLMQRANGALFESGGGSRAKGALTAAAALSAVSAAVARSGGKAGPAGGAAVATTLTATTTTASKRQREALLRHAAAVDRAFRLSRGRLPGTPFRIWRGLPFARVAARAAHGTALVALAIGHGAPATLTTRLLANLVAESCLRAVPLAGGPLAYVVFEQGFGTGGATSNVALLERWAAKEEARERKQALAGGGLKGGLASMFAPPWRRGVGPATARRRKGWTVLGTARRAMMLAGAAGVLMLVPAGVAFTAVTTAARWVLAAFFDSAGF